MWDGLLAFAIDKVSKNSRRLALSFFVTQDEYLKGK
jgi:hypothetical protein